MASETASPLNTPQPEPGQAPDKAKKRRGMSQERMMLVLTGLFIAGVLIYSILPAGPVRVLAMIGFTVGVVWALNKSMSTR